MQSGIKASAELRAAFTTLLADPSKRGLVVNISTNPEKLIPGETVPSSSSDFIADLRNLAPLISDHAAAYIILKQDAISQCTAVTYVPNRAPVRQKTLFASTRLTLVRELGTEHFGSTLFVTEQAELTAEGWAKHEAHGALSAPLTAEEQNLEGIKEAEAKESTGTGVRRGHVSSGLSMPVSEDALAALRMLQAGEKNIVQLHIDTTKETIVLAPDFDPGVSITPNSLASRISATSPQYTFYAYTSPTQPEPVIVFIYTCPTASKIRERMLYASSRSSIASLAANEASITIKVKLEASNPDEITGDTIVDEVEPGLKHQTKSDDVAGKVFSRPKRPGRR